MRTLANKMVVITGAGSGIGRALAVEAARRGARLALADWNEPAAHETARLAGGGPHLVRAVDVRDEAAVAGFARDVDERGGADVLVNNAGVSMSDMIGEMPRADFEWLFDINFWGVVRCTEAFLPQLRARPEAHVVNLSSLFGLVAVPSQSAYSASKFAVRGYTEALAQELDGTGVRVTCVHPGGVRTDIVRNGRHRRNTRGEATETATMASAFDKLARTSPEAAARVIWRGVLDGEPRVLVGSDARLLDLVQRLFPTRYPSLMRAGRRLFERRTGERL